MDISSWGGEGILYAVFLDSPHEAHSLTPDRRGIGEGNTGKYTAQMYLMWRSSTRDRMWVAGCQESLLHASA